MGEYEYNPELCREMHGAVNARLQRLEQVVITGNGQPSLMSELVAMRGEVGHVAGSLKSADVRMAKMERMMYIGLGILIAVNVLLKFVPVKLPAVAAHPTSAQIQP